MSDEKLHNLGQSISDYWIAYGEKVQIPTGTARTWHEFDLEQKRLIQERTRSLIEACADFEGIAFSDDATANTITDFCPQKPVLVRWGTKQVLIFPWLDLQAIDAEQFLDYRRKLPHNIMSIAVTPHSLDRASIEKARASRDKGFALLLASPEDVDALARLAWSVKELISYKVTRIYLESGIDADAIFSSWQLDKFRAESMKRKAAELLSLQKVINLRKDDPRKWIRHPEYEKLLTATQSNDFVGLIGKSASGKTTLALSIADRYQKAGDTVWYIDIGNLTSKRTYAVGISIFQQTLKSSKKVTIVLDDLHTQPSLARSLIAFLRILQANLIEGQLRIIGICWPEFEADLNEIIGINFKLFINASDVREALIALFHNKLNQEQINLIREQAGDDLYLLRLWLENSTESHIANALDLAGKIWRTRTQGSNISADIAQRTLFITYVTGQYECDTPKAFLQEIAGISRSQVMELIKNKFLVDKGSTVSVPHRSFAKLMTDYFGTDKSMWNWFNREKHVSSIGDIFVRYLEAIDSSQVWSVLKLIEQGGAIRDSTKSQEHLQMVIEIWRSVDRLINKISEQQTEDPTWRRTISSSYFACQAFAAIGKPQDAQGSIDFIRDVYTVNSGKLEVKVNRLSTAADFREIRKRMAVEEKDGTFPTQYDLETSENIDVYRMHANWAAGLIIGAESFYHPIGDNDLRALALAVEARTEQLDYFYPARVPWITARVLIGLSLAGRTVDNSPVVKRVADWLIRSRKDGGARDGLYWLPGTDGWNTPLETTTMAVLALRSVGIPADNPILLKTYDWIKDQRSDWTRPGNELDGAVALEVQLSMHGDWNEVRPEALYLARWADAIALWRNATESAESSQEQSCRAAQVAAFLITAMWRTLRSDLPKLVIAFGITGNSEKGSDTMGTPSARSTSFEYDVAISYAGENRDYVEKVAKGLKKAGVRVFYDQFNQSELWGKDLYTYLDNIYRVKAKYCVMFLSSEYAEKAWTNHERRSAQAKAFQENQEYILPVRFDSTEIPGIPPTIGYVDAGKLTPGDLCKLIQEKLR